MSGSETNDTMGSALGTEWSRFHCFECGRATDDRGTAMHPPLCAACWELWYPAGESDEEWLGPGSGSPNQQL